MVDSRGLLLLAITLCRMLIRRPFVRACTYVRRHQTMPKEKNVAKIVCNNNNWKK
jgi:hypothetical protein